MALATTSDLSAILRREIDEEDTAALFALDSASAMIEAYLGQPVGEVEDDTVTLDGTGTRVVLLPAFPVSDVSTVSIDGEELDADDYQWSATGELRRTGAAWPTTLRSIEVTYTHGYATTPAAIVAIAATMAARLYETPIATRQESIGGYSVTYANPGGATIQAAEALALDRYRRTR